MAIGETYVVTVLLDVSQEQDIDDRAESRTYIIADRESGQAVIVDSIIAQGLWNNTADRAGRDSLT